MTDPLAPTWDPAIYFATPNGTMLVRPSGPCGDTNCLAKSRDTTWLVVRVTRNEREGIWTVCARCAADGRLETWKRVDRVEVLGTYDLAAGEPRWHTAPIRIRKYEINQFVEPSAPPHPRTQPARQRVLLETV